MQVSTERAGRATVILPRLTHVSRRSSCRAIPADPRLTRARPAVASHRAPPLGAAQRAWWRGVDDLCRRPRVEHQPDPDWTRALTPTSRARWNSGAPVLANRNPLLLLRFDGVLLFRLTDRALMALLFHDPPRSTRFERSPGPVALTVARWGARPVGAGAGTHPGSGIQVNGNVDPGDRKGTARSSPSMKLRCRDGGTTPNHAVSDAETRSTSIVPAATARAYRRMRPMKRRIPVRSNRRR